jgi:hypothetical protein
LELTEAGSSVVLYPIIWTLIRRWWVERVLPPGQAAGIVPKILPKQSLLTAKYTGNLAVLWLQSGGKQNQIKQLTVHLAKIKQGSHQGIIREMVFLMWAIGPSGYIFVRCPGADLQSPLPFRPARSL